MKNLISIFIKTSSEMAFKPSFPLTMRECQDIAIKQAVRRFNESKKAKYRQTNLKQN